MSKQDSQIATCSTCDADQLVAAECVASTNCVTEGCQDGGQDCELGSDTVCKPVPCVSGEDSYPFNADPDFKNYIADQVVVTDDTDLDPIERVNIVGSNVPASCSLSIDERTDITGSDNYKDNFVATADGYELTISGEGKAAKYELALRNHLLLTCTDDSEIRLQPVSVTISVESSSSLRADDVKTCSHSLTVEYVEGCTLKSTGEDIIMTLKEGVSTPHVSTPFGGFSISNVATIQHVDIEINHEVGLDFEFFVGQVVKTSDGVLENVSPNHHQLEYILYDHSGTEMAISTDVLFRLNTATAEYEPTGVFNTGAVGSKLRVRAKYDNADPLWWEPVVRAISITAQGSCVNADGVSNNQQLDKSSSITISIDGDTNTCNMGFSVLSPQGTHHADDGTCQPCDCGSFQENVGQDSCDNCGAGSFGSVDNWPFVTRAEHCSPCACGQFSTEEKQCGACPSVCPAGTAGAESEDSSVFGSEESACTPCPCGSFQPAEGQCACVKCVAGTIGMKAQGLNDAGLFSGAEHCAICEDGRFSLEGDEGLCEDSASASACKKLCPAGTYGEASVASDASHFVGTETIAAEHCNECPSGWSQPDAGQTGCVQCSAGEFSPPGSDACHQCEWDESFTACSATCQTCDSAGGTLTPITGNAPTKIKSSELSTSGYDLAHMSAASEQCTDVPADEPVECNTRCCPLAHTCNKEFSCGFTQHASGEYAIQVKHQYDSPNQVHKCHLLEDGFGGSECVCECYDSEVYKPEQPTYPDGTARRLTNEQNLETALGL